MASTRNNFSIGVFATNADEVQNDEDERIDGNFYRNTSFSQFQQNVGKAFQQLPLSENFNQQIYNISYFANIINRQSILGWINAIEYNRGSVVFGSDNKIYFCIKDGNINVDPITENQESPVWWQEFTSGVDLYNIYADETPGNEGANLVGCTYQKVKRGARVGVTLQQNLDYLYPLLDKMNNFRILASISGLLVRNTSSPTLNLSSTLSFNVSSIDFTTYSKQDPSSPSSQLIGKLKINFINPLPTDYMVFGRINITSYYVSVTSGSGNKRYVLGHESFQYGNRTTTSVDIGALLLTNINGADYPSFWGADWGTEDPLSRYRWVINFFCAVID